MLMSNSLSQSETDEQLEHSVTEAFQQFGNVYVKIRRDSRQMPFAFAQYTVSLSSQISFKTETCCRTSTMLNEPSALDGE